MNIDVDLIQAGQWTHRLLQSEISTQDVERARLYGLYDDVHIRALVAPPFHFEILGSPKTWLIAQLIQQQSVPVKQIQHLSVSELNGYYSSLGTTSEALSVIVSEHFIDHARVLQLRIKEQKLSLSDAGKLIGKSRSEICNLMRILKMDRAILDKIKQQPRVGFGHAKIMAGLPSAQQIILLQNIISESLTVQQAEAMAKNLRDNSVSISADFSVQTLVEKSADVLRLEKMLTEHFAAQVEINEKDSKLEINYHHDVDILQGILEKIGLADL